MYFRIDIKRFEILFAPFWGEVKFAVTGAIKEKTIHVICTPA